MPVGINWLDVTALLIIGICGIDGLVKGLIKSVFNLTGFFVSLYAAKILTSPVTDYIYKNTGISTYIKDYFMANSKSFNSFATPVVNMIGGNTSIENIMTYALISLLSFFIVFISVKILLALIEGSLDTTAKLPVIKQFNRVGGLIFGIIKGALIIYIIFALLTPIIPILSTTNPIITGLNGSIFAINFYRYNLIVVWIKGINYRST
jgi:uncharacterized membrane protein required for colicin V production